MFVTRPPISFDVTLEDRQGHAVEFHRNVLVKISSVFADLITGDQEEESIRLNDPEITISELKAMQAFVYAQPHARKIKKFNDKALLILIGKYNIQIMKPHANIYFQNKVIITFLSQQ